MTIQVTISSIVGTSPYDLYVCQVDGTDCFYIDRLTSEQLPYVFDIPAPYNNSESYLFKVVDDYGSISTGTTYLYASPTPTATVTPTITPTPTITATVTITPTPSVSQTPGASPSPTTTQTPTNTPTNTQTPTPSVSETHGASPTPTTTETPTNTPTQTITPTLTGTLGVTPTATETPTPSPTPNNTYNVTNSGASAYIVNGVSNPSLNLFEGQTYTFNIAATGHPFWIKTVPVTGTGSAYNDGVTNNGIANGTITFTVPYDAPSTLYYICQFHGVMQGVINIIDVPAPSPTNTETPTNTPTNTQTPTPTLSQTPEASPSPTTTETPTNTPSNTPTETPTNTPTNNPSPTPTVTITQTPTSSVVSYGLNLPLSTNTFGNFSSNLDAACNSLICLSAASCTWNSGDFVYSSKPNYNSLEVGDIFYTNSSLSTVATTVNGYRILFTTPNFSLVNFSSGVIESFVTCASPTPTSTMTPTPTITPTRTPTNTPTNTPNPSPTPTNTVTPTNTGVFQAFVSNQTTKITILNFGFNGVSWQNVNGGTGLAPGVDSAFTIFPFTYGTSTLYVYYNVPTGGSPPVSITLTDSAGVTQCSNLGTIGNNNYTNDIFGFTVNGTTPITVTLVDAVC